MALLIKIENGDTSLKWVTPKEKTYSLEELQEFVGGDIELVFIPHSDMCMVINEEGKIMHLPVNPFATSIYNVFFDNRYHDIIVGNVLLCVNNEIE